MDRQKLIERTSVVGIVGNVILVIFKAIVGQITGSVAIVADAFNNLADAMSSIVTMIGTKLAGKAPDRKHPYGYGQVEYISSVVIAVLILYTGVSTFSDALDRILHPVPADYDIAAIVVIVAGVAVKIFLGRFFRSRGKRTDSEALKASGADATLDAAVSSTILAGIAVNAIWGITIDGWLGAGIAVVIIKSGFDVLRESLSQIIGERVPAELSKKIEDEIAKEPGVLGVYDLILNRYGPELTIGSVHIQVSDDTNAVQIDKMTREIAGRMYAKFGIIMTVGIYAANLTSPVAREMFRKVHAIADSHPEILQMHGFYVDPETKQASFDMILDFGCPDRDHVKRLVLEQLGKEYPDYKFHITLDADFSD